MAIPNYLTTVTPLSKFLAMALFVLLPFLGFFLGTSYQEVIDFQNVQTVSTDSSTKPHPAPSTDETANWKTYKDKENRFSINYPPDFHIASPAAENFPALTLRGPNNIIINIFTNPLYGGTVTSITDGFVNKIIPSAKAKLIERTKYSIDGTDGEKLTSVFSDKNGNIISIQVTAITTYKDKSYHFSGLFYQIGSLNNKDEGIKAFDQILSTFRFE